MQSTEAHENIPPERSYLFAEFSYLASDVSLVQKYYEIQFVSYS